MTQVASNGLEQLALIEIEGPASSQEKKVRKARSKDATSVPDGVGMLFASYDMFPQFGVMPQSRTQKEIIISGLRSAMRSALGKVHSAPELPDDDDRNVVVNEDLDEEPETGPKCEFDDEQLSVEQRAWVPGERQAFLMHIGCLEENLAFLAATDTKPRVWQEKGEILQWIWSVDQIDGRNVKDIPFSFVNCCDAARIDPDELRRMLLQLPFVRSLLVNLCLARDENLPALRSKKYYEDYVGPEVCTPPHPVYQFAGVS